MDWRGIRIIAFDTETTGLNPEEGHRVIEFAGVELHLGPDGDVVRTTRHEWLFDPGQPIPREVTEVNHITDDDVRGKPKFEEKAKSVHALLKGAVTIAHNYPFDQRFLTAEFTRANLRWPAPLAEIDTADLSRLLYKEARSHRLGELANRLEVPLVEAHRAANDAEACGRCFVAMANRNGAPSELTAMIEWADAVGEPPDGGHLVRNADGLVIFGPGEGEGQPVEERPELLHWMSMARTRTAEGWDYRFPEPVRRWAERFLRIRASGRAAQHMKGFGPGDWGIDPPIGTASVGHG
jgi:DNA polymerase III subunit epsilon